MNLLELSIAERAELLDKAGVVSDLDWRQVELLAGYLKAYEVEEGTDVVVEGARERFMCILVEGSFQVLKKDDNGVLKEIGELAGCKTFGEMSLIDEEPRSATVRAGAKSVILMLAESSYRSLLLKTPALGIIILSRITRLLSARLRQASGKLVEFLDES